MVNQVTSHTRASSEALRIGTLPGRAHRRPPRQCRATQRELAKRPHGLKTQDARYSIGRRDGQHDHREEHQALVKEWSPAHGQSGEG